MGRAEGYVENYLVRSVERIGGLIYKFTSGSIGVPDRIVVAFGRTVFIECKAPGEKTRPSQDYVIAEMRAQGADVRVFDTREQVDELIEEMKLWKIQCPPSTPQLPSTVPIIQLRGRSSVRTSA